MTWYLVVRSDLHYSESVPASALTEYLDSVPELRRTDPAGYEAAGGTLGWVRLVIAACSRSGSYAVDQDRLPQQVNVVELICSSSHGSHGAQQALAGRIADALGWEVADDESGEILQARSTVGTRPSDREAHRPV